MKNIIRITAGGLVCLPPFGCAGYILGIVGNIEHGGDLSQLWRLIVPLAILAGYAVILNRIENRIAEQNGKTDGLSDYTGRKDKSNENTCRT